MEHHYSLTSRMLGIFVTALVLLGALLFAIGYLIGRETVAVAEPVAAPALLKGVQQHLPGAAKAGAIPPAAPGQAAPQAVPALPVVPGLPPVPGGAKLPEMPVPAIPAVPAAPAPKPVSDAGGSGREAGLQAASRHAGDAVAAIRKSADKQPAQIADAHPPEGMPKEARAVSARFDATPHKPADAGSRNEPSRGFVVYAGAFESASGAEGLVDELRRRNLNAQTGTMEKPGRRPMVTVWVGVFDDRSAARAALASVREAGVSDPYIKLIP